MRKLHVILLLSCCIALAWTACSSINFELPQGPRGLDGKSAYELWKEAVQAGTIAGDPAKTELVDFLTYVKGEKGEDGKSAFDMWKEMIASGEVTNPHNPKEKWAAEKNTEADFWNFMTGRDGTTPHVGENGHWYIGDSDTGMPAAGASAYEEWKTMVEKGAIEWPKDQVSEVNYYQYLKGKDGDTPHVGENGNWYIGDSDTGVQAKGAKGDAGTSAYDLWKKDVEDGKVTGKDGQPLPKDKTTREDFYSYIVGSDGDSAYELWKAKVANGDVDDPHNPSDKWPTNKVSETDFWDYLRGVNGVDGTSAYELWKADLKKRCGTDEALRDRRTDGIWRCDKNTLNDFYEFLSGKDGEDPNAGKDGKPGSIGKPGKEVTIIAGVPNVIAQYSQSEYGEYVRTSDGGVLYKVYDTRGAVAPHAKVTGMPGIAEGKEYTADENGEFVVPKEDLPEIQELEKRWGQTAKVTLEGEKEPITSAKNTYVPNRVHVRLVKKDYQWSLGLYMRLDFDVQRKLNPDDDWMDYPDYLPGNSVPDLKAYRVSDKDKPNSFIDPEQSFYTSSGYYTVNGSSSINKRYAVYTQTYRLAKQNEEEIKNSNDEYWDGTDVYYTLRSKTPSYGELVQWNGVANLPYIQREPRLKSIKLKGISKEEPHYFASATGELDLSLIDFNNIYEGYPMVETKNDGREYVYFKKLTLEDAKKSKLFYVEFSRNSSEGIQRTDSRNNRSSSDEPGFKVLTPYLGSSISVSSINTSQFLDSFYGQLIQKEGSTGNEYEFKPSSSKTTHTVEVTYED